MYFAPLVGAVKGVSAEYKRLERELRAGIAGQMSEATLIGIGQRIAAFDEITDVAIDQVVSRRPTFEVQRNCIPADQVKYRPLN